jgi:predicted acylesterase/phospholipase RssA
MASLPEIARVIAVDVSPELEMRAQLDVSDGVSGWRILWQRLWPFGMRAEAPMIANVLTRSSMVASIHSARDRDAERAASLYLRLPVSDLKLLAFEQVDEIAARGYEASVDAIRAWSKQAG